MLYLPDFYLDQLLLEDIQYGDLTTQSLNFDYRTGTMTFSRKQSGRISGVTIVAKLLTKLGLIVQTHVADGQDLTAGSVILTAKGDANLLHQGWKVAQNILEWCSGVSHYTAEMLKLAHEINPSIHIACTRKSIPGTKFLAISAILHGGAILHRAGTAETILLFANHRRFFHQSDDWQKHIHTLRQAAPEKKIIVEVNNMEEAQLALFAQPDILQLDKFTVEQIMCLQKQVTTLNSRCQLSITGGITKENIQQFAMTGVSLLVTSAPYHAQPADIKVVLSAN